MGEGEGVRIGGEVIKSGREREERKEGKGEEKEKWRREWREGVWVEGGVRKRGEE